MEKTVEAVELIYPITCYDRELVILVNPEQSDAIYAILDKAYDVWINPQVIEDKVERACVECSCVEEHLLDCVQAAGYTYVECEDSDREQEE